MEANYLHIWPRGQFMMIALPNQDKSFTVTLFMPTSKFDAITDGPSLTAFFEEFFPDSLDLIGRHEHFPENVLGSIFTSRRLCLTLL